MIYASAGGGGEEGGLIKGLLWQALLRRLLAARAQAQHEALKAPAQAARPMANLVCQCDPSVFVQFGRCQCGFAAAMAPDQRDVHELLVGLSQFPPGHAARAELEEALSGGASPRGSRRGNSGSSRGSSRASSPVSSGVFRAVGGTYYEGMPPKPPHDTLTAAAHRPATPPHGDQSPRSGRASPLPGAGVFPEGASAGGANVGGGRVSKLQKVYEPCAPSLSSTPSRSGRQSPSAESAVGSMRSGTLRSGQARSRASSPKEDPVTKWKRKRREHQAQLLQRRAERKERRALGAQAEAALTTEETLRVSILAEKDKSRLSRGQSPHPITLSAAPHGVAGTGMRRLVTLHQVPVDTQRAMSDVISVHSAGVASEGSRASAPSAKGKDKKGKGKGKGKGKDATSDK